MRAGRSPSSTGVPESPAELPVRSSQYTAEFQKRLGDFTANLGDVRLLRSEGRQDLETFARSGVDEVDYERFQEEVRDAPGELDPAGGCAGDRVLGRAGFWAAPKLRFPRKMKKPVVQTSLPGLARNLEGLQKMQVSAGTGGGAALGVAGGVLTPPGPAEEQHGGLQARRGGSGAVADAEFHGAVAGGFGGESVPLALPTGVPFHQDGGF